MTDLDYSRFWLVARLTSSVYSNAVLKMEHQEFFRQEILVQDFHCDSETDQLLAAAIVLVESMSVLVLCVLQLAQPPELVHAARTCH